MRHMETPGTWDPPPERWSALIKRLLDWHRPMLRDMPWRTTRDPYRIWVAEVMLHQTQVRTVIPYYHRFLEWFPTVQDLAAAPLDSVLKAWEGLGYYARARNLHVAAQRVISCHGGKLPDTKEDLLLLPGIGDYTAGAILSIAFGQHHPALDGNVVRVLCRVFDVSEPPSRSHVREKLWDLAARLLPRGRASDFNQAMMDLGATLCAPRRPRCDLCPWASECRANSQNLQEKRPVKAARRRLPHYDIAVGVISRDNGEVLIAKRPPEGLLGGLWEFPGGKIEKGETPAEALIREAREELRIVIDQTEPFTVVPHAYTHFKVTLNVLRAHWVSGEPQCCGCTDWRWEKITNLSRYAFPSATKKIIAALHKDVVRTGPC